VGWSGCVAVAVVWSGSGGWQWGVAVDWGGSVAVAVDGSGSGGLIAVTELFKKSVRNENQQEKITKNHRNDRNDHNSVDSLPTTFKFTPFDSP
jgi:ammonia channel protein AmtB